MGEKSPAQLLEEKDAEIQRLKTQWGNRPVTCAREDCVCLLRAEMRIKELEAQAKELKKRLCVGEQACEHVSRAEEGA
jgi:hypothetical protein